MKKIASFDNSLARVIVEDHAVQSREVLFTVAKPLPHSSRLLRPLSSAPDPIGRQRMSSSPGRRGPLVSFAALKANFKIAPSAEGIENAWCAGRVVTGGRHVAHAEIVGLQFLAPRILQE